MAKKPKNNEPVKMNMTLLDFVSSKYINDSSLDYSMGTLDRAIVGIDGMKSAQRKAIFTLSKITGEIKTVSCAGRMISDNIYLHGDTSASGTLQQLASPVANNYPLIGKRGGFGTIVSPTPASPRYTYVKKNKATEQLMLPDLDIVPMVENYDGTTFEPKYFLPIIPISLFGSNGLSVGYKSLILPYSLPDIVHNCIQVLKGKKQREMMPNFTSVGANEYVESLGDGKFITFGKAEIIDASNVKITGLPHNLTVEKFVEKCIAMEDSGVIKSYDNQSTENIEILITLPRGKSKDWVEMDALEYLGLSGKISENLVTLQENGLVKVYSSPNDVITDYIGHRFGFYIKRYEKRKADATKQLYYTLLIKLCFENDITAKLKGFKNRNEVFEFINKLNDDNETCVSEDDINKITSFPMYRWTQEYKDDIENDIEKYMNEIAYNDELLENHDKITDIYIEELKELLKLKFD